MRARNIKPGFYKNEDIAECSFAARLLFPGLWMLADREGRLENRPKRIKMEIFPADNVDIEPLLAELEKHGLIKTYEANGMSLIWLPGFEKHQTPHCMEKASTLPAHPDDNDPDWAPKPKPEASTIQAQCEHSASTVQAQGQNPLIPDSLFLNPEQEEEGYITRATPPPPEEVKVHPPAHTPPTVEPYDLEFLQWWDAYPKQVGQDAAWEVWCGKKKAHQLPGLSMLLAALDDQRQSARWTDKGGQFIPDPANYIRGGHWKDKLPRANDSPDDEWRKLVRRDEIKKRPEVKLLPERKTQ